MNVEVAKRFAKSERAETRSHRAKHLAVRADRQRRGVTTDSDEGGALVSGGAGGAELHAVTKDNTLHFARGAELSGPRNSDRLRRGVNAVKCVTGINVTTIRVGKDRVAD